MRSVGTEVPKVSSCGQQRPKQDKHYMPVRHLRGHKKCKSRDSEFYPGNLNHKKFLYGAIVILCLFKLHLTLLNSMFHFFYLFIFFLFFYFILFIYFFLLKFFTITFIFDFSETCSTTSLLLTTSATFRFNAGIFFSLSVEMIP